MGQLKALSALCTEQQLLGNQHSFPTDTIRALEAANETETMRGLGTMFTGGGGPPKSMKIFILETV